MEKLLQTKKIGMCLINYLIFELPNKTMAKLYTIVNKTVGASSPSVLTQQNSNAALPIIKTHVSNFK